MGRKVIMVDPEKVTEDTTPAELLQLAKTSQEPEEYVDAALSEVIPLSGTPTDARNSRDEFILKYYSTGLTTKTITEMVALKAKETHWEPISEARVRAIIAEHYKKRNMLLRGVDGKENEAAMREASLEQQEKFLEKLILTYNRHEANKTFKSLFEQTQLADLIGRTRQQLIENRNWNDSRKNPLVQATSHAFEVNVFESSGEKMIVNGPSEGISRVLEHLRKKFENSDSEVSEA